MASLAASEIFASRSGSPRVCSMERTRSPAPSCSKAAIKSASNRAQR